MIKHVSFKHGWFYHYRINLRKIDALCNTEFSNLKGYLTGLMNDCPEEPFLKGLRCSHIKDPLQTQLNEICGHEISSFAERAHSTQDFKSAHSRVQLELLQNDDSTLAVEVPVWTDETEKDLFSSETLSGHIDVLRIEDGLIWVWDYKPNAHLEKFADTQTFLYSLLLSKRANIPLNKFRCGYFDEKRAYVFKPEEEFMRKIEGIKK